MKGELSEIEYAAIRANNLRRIITWTLLIICIIELNLSVNSTGDSGVFTGWSNSAVAIVFWISFIGVLILPFVLIYHRMILDPITFVTATLKHFELDKEENHQTIKQFFLDFKRELVKFENHVYVKMLVYEEWPYDRASHMVRFIDYLGFSIAYKQRRGSITWLKATIYDTYLSYGNTLVSSGWDQSMIDTVTEALDDYYELTENRTFYRFNDRMKIMLLLFAFGMIFLLSLSLAIG